MSCLSLVVKVPVVGLGIFTDMLLRQLGITFKKIEGMPPLSAWDPEIFFPATGESADFKGL